MTRAAPVLALFGVACVTTPVAPPPAIDPARLARARADHPGLVGEVELLEWRAREHATRGELADADRLAGLARNMLATAEGLGPRSCPEVRRPSVRTATVSAAPPVSAAPDRPRRRRTAPAPAPPAPPPKAPASEEERLQDLATALGAIDGANLDPNGRVRLDAGRRALLDGQRALAAGARERAKQHIARAAAALASLSGEAAAAGPEAPPLEALARDLAAANVVTAKEGEWLVAALSSEANGGLASSAVATLDAVGRLLRVYGAVRACAGPEGQPAAALVAQHLEQAHQFPPTRWVVCPAAPSSPLYVALTFNGKRS